MRSAARPPTSRAMELPRSSISRPSVARVTDWTWMRAPAPRRRTSPSAIPMIFTRTLTPSARAIMRRGDSLGLIGLPRPPPAAGPRSAPPPRRRGPLRRPGPARGGVGRDGELPPEEAVGALAAALQGGRDRRAGGVGEREDPPLEL